MEMGKPPNHSGYWAGIEGDRSPIAHWQRLLLREWHSDHHASHIEQSFQAIIPHFRISYCKVCELYDVKLNIRRFKLA
ncbi:hypothetical protein Q75_09250 [Bacillus coahuilensis p1.1.43]|uniref:Uncharacterized protein n=1 Tax=Bacillus coahuilensis p1.1.43 TaxID=1150625 RepID=A0A147K833_9BACI|nr:hypothetical protein Q75_09250 [Bacillus coahuilensis p1.1.43]